ncbi:hypothetical protein RHOSPDRAFT_27254, partial [Rhodotorula sp. JG-1b]
MYADSWSSTGPRGTRTRCPGSFAPSQPQKKILRVVRHSWTTSMPNMAQSITDHVRVELHKWLLIKRETFEEALRNRRALHFDVLVLGIGDLLVDPAREIAARFKLAAARQTLSAGRDPNSRASDGWASQVETVYNHIHTLKSQYHIPDAEAGPFDEWHRQAKEELTQGVHGGWPLLVQYGVRKLLYFLYQALCELLNRAATDRAFEML